MEDQIKTEDQNRAEWTDTRDMQLIHIILDKKRQGEVIGGTCKSSVWNSIMEEFNTYFNLLWDVKKLKSRWLVVRPMTISLASVRDMFNCKKTSSAH